MKIETHHLFSTKIVEVLSESIVIAKIEDALNLMTDLYYQGFDFSIRRVRDSLPFLSVERFANSTDRNG